MTNPYRLAFGLCVTATLSCVVIAAWMTTIPFMSGGRPPTAGEALAMVALPAVASALASWAAWRGRQGWLWTATAVVGLLSVVFGFSFGGAFYAPLVLLVWAGIASFDAAPDPGDQGPSHLHR